MLKKLSACAVASFILLSLTADQQTWNGLREIQAIGHRNRANFNAMLNAELGPRIERAQFERFCANLRRDLAMREQAQSAQNNLSAQAMECLRITPQSLQLLQSVPADAQANTLNFAIQFVAAARQGGMMRAQAINGFWNLWSQSIQNGTGDGASFAFIAIAAVSQYDPQFEQHARAVLALPSGNEAPAPSAVPIGRATPRYS